MAYSTSHEPNGEQEEPKGLSRYWRFILRLLARRIEHDDVIEHVRENGQLVGRYMFMIVMSCAIATLGLLLSSPAVIIGAMLISPLMGPIMLMGFSFATLDLISLRRAILTLFCGTAAAIAMSFIIVKVSPLTDATPEILARTRPNLFDLLVAIFSGLAGGYSVINRKGETIVGVAIATALMPPLAVTGYGLAVGGISFALGSFGLFMTNLLAISLSVTILARLYSFGQSQSRTTGLWQSALIFLAFGTLSVPLGLALRDIAYEANVANTVKANLLTPFNGGRSRIGDIAIAFPKDEPIQIDASVMTRQRVSSAEQDLTQLFEAKLKRPVSLNLDQVLVDEDKALEQQEILKMAESSLAVPLRKEISDLQVLASRERSIKDLRNAIVFPTASAEINPDTRKAHIVGAPSDTLNLAAWRAMESGLKDHFPDWDINVQPPVMPLPLILFDEGAEDPSPQGMIVMDHIVWALQRWNLNAVESVGYASTAGARVFDNNDLALKRAESVAALLSERGFSATAASEYRAFRQSQTERQYGRVRFQSVMIRPAITPDE